MTDTQKKSFIAKTAPSIGIVNIIGGVLGSLSMAAILVLDRQGLAREAWAEMPAEQVRLIRTFAPVMLGYSIVSLVIGIGLVRRRSWSRLAGIGFYVLSAALSVYRGDWFWVALSVFFVFCLVHPEGRSSFED